MGMTQRTGTTTVRCGDTEYKFENDEDATGFEGCVNGGGRPGSCAELWRCVGRRDPRVDKELTR